MRELVAIELPGGPDFVRALRSAWDQGDAVAALDARLPAAQARAQLATLRPSRVVGIDGSVARVADGRPVEEGDALVVCTSGTSGEPRAAVLTLEAVAASARATSSRLAVDPGRHHWLACLPLAHIGGLSVVTRALLTGTALTVLPGFDAGEVTELGRRGQVTHVSLVATALRRLDPGLFALVLLGGAAPPEHLAPNVVTTYGLTETGSGVVYDGRPIDGVELAIGTGEPGGGAKDEILVRGPMLLRCYRDGTDPRLEGPGPTDRPAGPGRHETRDDARSPAAGAIGGDRRGGWLPTGDGGRLGPDGALEVTGRLAEVIVTGGEKVWPTAVEQVLARIPGVAEVAVWKRPDPEWGERVVAWVVPGTSAAPPALVELREAVVAELAPWAAPKELVLVPTLPRTSSGKVRRRLLR
ncbi:MAG TPA: AMP-binding protein [Acidimicrobiales bacterium]